MIMIFPTLWRTLRKLLFPPVEKADEFFYPNDGNIQVQLYDVAQQKLLAPILALQGEKISAITLSMDGRLAFLYSGRETRKGGGSTQVQVYDVEHRQLVAPIELPKGEKISKII